ncbi:MAG: hypothetical protein HXY30_11280 [Pseudorhodoplanes sp.]|nr:hypothetical protein [Pseudorhodoplanes sp.]
MHRTIGIVAFAALLSVAGSLPAAAVSREQAKKECQAQFGNVGGVRASERSGVSVSQQVAQCVKRKMSAQNK